MGANKKSLNLKKIILIISITVLVAGFYFYLFRNGNSGQPAKSAAGQNRKENPTVKNSNSINLVRPAFLDK
jgi:flagellar basal body-associated protein FliL